MEESRPASANTAWLAGDWDDPSANADVDVDVNMPTNTIAIADRMANIPLPRMRRIENPNFPPT